MDEDDIQQLDIDIHYAKLVDWLVSRQHTSKDWAESARSVREMINAAIQDMPEHPDITKLLSGTYINYFHCLKIVEILRETEADSKNILGWYTSQRMKDWQAVMKLYEKGGMYLAEAGQLLHRYVAYEMPGIRGQMARCCTIQQECDKKESDINKSATNAATAYAKHCKQLGIEGKHVRRELLGLLAELPSELDKVGAQMLTLDAAAKYYLAFIEYTCEGQHLDSLPMLRYIIEHGNVTTYEYIHGEAPLSIEDPADALLQEAQDGKGTDAEGIDFGDDAGAIDFGDDATEEDGGGIDFGDNDGNIDFGDDTQKIDWDAAHLAADITIEESGLAGGVARGTEALSILQNPNTRDRILDDVYELEGFLQQREVESSVVELSIVTINLWDEAPKALQMVSTATITEQLCTVKDVINSLSTPKMLQLFLISGCHTYVDRLAETLQREEARTHVPADAVVQLQQRRTTSNTQHKTLQRQLQGLQHASKGLQAQLQEAISDKYKGRPVNIMGVNQQL